MLHSEEKAMEIIKRIAGHIGLPRQIQEVCYREDYMDYQVLLDENHHCEIREKLIDTYVNTKGGVVKSDVEREIRFRLENAIEFEEWEERQPRKEGQQQAGEKKGDVAVDDSANYDF